MTKDLNHIENQPELNGEIQEMISGTRIDWSKTKEEIWPDILGKIESKSFATRNNRVVYLQFKKLAVAAVILILLGIPAVVFFYTKTIENTSGQNTGIFLPDNSRVVFKAQSVLSYKPLLWKFSRTVKFEGEALFDVQKGKKFEVVSKRGKTIVLGTQFDIYSRDNNYNVTCVSGKVKVIESVYRNEVILFAGQKAILKPDGNFEIQDKINIQPENSNKSRNQTLDEEINTILSTAPSQTQPANKERNKVPVGKQTAVKEQAAEKEQNKAEEQNVINEQSRSQSQVVEDLQNKEQTRTSTQEHTGNKEQGLNRNQEKAMGQSTVNHYSKDKFRASLTPEQISILENQQMSREEKKKVFMGSLSDEQRMLLEEQRTQQSEGNKNEPGESDKMKEQHKMQTREQVRENTSNETQEQQMQQNLENKETAKPGNGNGPGSGNGNESENEKGN